MSHTRCWCVIARPLASWGVSSEKGRGTLQPKSCSYYACNCCGTCFAKHGSEQEPFPKDASLQTFHDSWMGLAPSEHPRSSHISVLGVILGISLTLPLCTSKLGLVPSCVHVSFEQSPFFGFPFKAVLPNPAEQTLDQ